MARNMPIARMHSHLPNTPVVLYLAPVAYAGLVYGWEGGVLTGLWAGVLASIIIPIWHTEDNEWVLELFFVAAVVAMGW